MDPSSIPHLPFSTEKEENSDEEEKHLSTAGPATAGKSKKSALVKNHQEHRRGVKNNRSLNS
jgi:hypothetical protein